VLNQPEHLFSKCHHFFLNEIQDIYAFRKYVVGRADTTVIELYVGEFEGFG
jgi:hypothetical protein